jgi:Domain of unknown function (DUF4340)
MRSKVTLVLLFLNVALFFYIFYFERDWRIERASIEARRRVLGAEASDIRSLEVVGPSSATSFTLERHGEAWYLTKPVEWPANANAVGRIINELQFLEHVTSFSTGDLAKNGQKLADYGLENPRLTLRFTSGEAAPGSAPRTTVLRIGDTTKVGDHLYLLSPDSQRIHVVDRSLGDSLAVSFDDLRSDTLLSIPVFEARSLNIQSANPSGVRVRLHRDGNRWSFDTPVIARAGKKETELAINALDSLRVRSFVPAGSQPSPASAPTMRVTLEGNNRQQTLVLGGQEGPDTYYAQLEDRSAVFTVLVPQQLMSTLRNAADDLRDRHVLDFDANAVTSVSLSAPNQPEVALQRLEVAGGREGGWQIIRRGSAPGGPQSLQADSAAVQRLLGELQTLSALKFQSDAPTAADLENWGFNKPEREITLTLSSPAPAQMTLQIGLPTQRDNMAYARIAGSSSIYAIEPDILGDAAASAVAWRDRLLFSLPATARITSLSLTNVADGSAVYAHKLADAETWEATLASEPQARRDALTAILGSLRTLRAARFVEDGFPDKVQAAGEQRPWRYSLVATIALPAGSSGSQTSDLRLQIAERTGGSEQLAGSKEIGAVFSLEQPLLDALWTLTKP